jgi:predicted ATPase
MDGIPPGNYVSQINVEALFGEFTYKIGPLKVGADPRVIVLYGDNGTGKTTILQLLRSLLSPSNVLGHRSRVAKFPFKKFEIIFRDGTTITASREKEIVGPYLLSISGANDFGVVRSYVKTDQHLDVKSSTWTRTEQGQFQAVIERLAQISSEVGFLDDKRTFTRSDFGGRERLQQLRQIYPEGLFTTSSASDLDDPVADSVAEMVDSVRKEALLRQRRGAGDSQSIYKNLIGTLARGATPAVHSIEGLRQRLVETERMSKELSDIGLTTPLQHLDMVQQIESASLDRRIVVSDLVAAYVESTEALFSALTELKALLDKFVARLNFFLSPKRVGFSVSEGLNVFSKEGRPLKIGMLSSGERHLIMMLSQALLRRNDASVLVIDEPELSLNMKWQRELVGSILDCLGGGASQVIMATHSIEIAARYRGNVVRLWASEEEAASEENY